MNEIMRRIYRLASDNKNFSYFIEKEGCGNECGLGGIRSSVMRRDWRPFDGNYNPVNLELHPSDTGKRNYKFDISAFLDPFLVFSEECLNFIGSILENRGQFLNVITESKRKNFSGYLINNSLSNCLDKNLSDYRRYENGILVKRYVLVEKNITDEYIFSLEEGSRVFVTEKFRQLVEKYKLKGFDFSKVIQLS